MKYFVGFLVGIVFAMFVCYNLFPEVAAAIVSGSFFPMAWECVKGLFGR